MASITAQVGAAHALPNTKKRRGTTALVAGQFARHRAALVGILILGVLIFLVILTPFAVSEGPNRTNIRLIRQPPTAGHIMGTDELGRDVWTRLLHGGRISLAVGLAVVILSLTIGVTFGSIAGYHGGLIDDALVRLTEAIQCFPRLIIIITLVALFGPSFLNLILVMGLLGWTSTFRLVRGQVYSIKEQEFVTAARVVGASGWRIMFRHCLPNTVSPVIVAATFGVAGAILTEAALGFLGLGVQPPQASWGNILNAAQGLPYLEGAPWLWIPPVVMISLSVISINLIGDALRDATDPRAIRR